MTKKSAATAGKSPGVGVKLNRSASGRRISFDDNIQMIDTVDTGGAHHKSFDNGFGKAGVVSDDFLIGLEKEWSFVT